MTAVDSDTSLRFSVDPRSGESLRACYALARGALPTSRGNLLLLGLYFAVALASFALTPETSLTTFIIGMSGVLGTAYGLRVVARANAKQLQSADPHASETHFVEVSSTGVRTWCAHVDARYPWSDFTKTIENSEFYLFVRPSGGGVAIPKRLVDDSTDVQLRERIREWSPDRGANLARDAHNG